MSLDPLVAPPPRSDREKERRWDARQREAGKRQVGRVYVEQLTLAEMEMLKAAWGFKNRSQVIEVAVKYLAQQTRDGLKEIRL